MSKKILVLDACIRGEKSRTKKLLDAALETLKEKHPDWEFDTLVLGETKLSWMDAASLEERDRLLAAKQYDHPRFALAHQLQAADGVILAAPFWDLSFPAVVKVYVENVCAESITFYTDETGLHGKCRAKWLLHLTTRGGQWEQEKLQDTSYLKQMCRFFGIPEYKCVSADGVDIDGLPGPEILRNAIEQTREVCREL